MMDARQRWRWHAGPIERFVARVSPGVTLALLLYELVTR